jgi:ABC-2 type transport system permease protein
VIEKALSASVRALSQAAIVYLLALLLGVGIDLNPLSILGVVVGAALFSTFSLIIACIVKTRERFMGIGQVLTMPIFFASNAIYPLSLMPPWLRAVSDLNPLTYEVDALRYLMLTSTNTDYGLLPDFGVLLGTTVLLTAMQPGCMPAWDSDRHLGSAGNLAVDLNQGWRIHMMLRWNCSAIFDEIPGGMP